MSAMEVPGVVRWVIVVLMAWLLGILFHEYKSASIKLMMPCSKIRAKRSRVVVSLLAPIRACRVDWGGMDERRAIVLSIRALLGQSVAAENSLLYLRTEMLPLQISGVSMSSKGVVSAPTIKPALVSVCADPRTFEERKVAWPQAYIQSLVQVEAWERRGGAFPRLMPQLEAILRDSDRPELRALVPVVAPRATISASNSVNRDEGVGHVRK